MRASLSNYKFCDIRVRVIVVICSVCVSNCYAYELALPNVGTDISYDFSPWGQVFEIVTETPWRDALQAEVTFSQGKHLRYAANSDELIFGIDLILHAENIVKLFDPMEFRFDETISLMLEGGAIGLSSKNIGVSAVDGCETYTCDEYTFRWDFHPPSDYSFYGFKWSITPSLIPGATVPDRVAIKTYMFAAGTIQVVPEPNAIVIMMLLTVGGALSRSRRCRAT